jgi:CMP-N,N'-diacetyllegionaminic acid synthase
MNQCVALITARGGSKGLPGKNLREIGGKPLIAWSIEAARGCARLSRVLVSTDSEEIADVARRYGAEVPFLRPAELAGDESPHILTSEHAITWLDAQPDGRPEYTLLLQPTSPLRSVADIEAALGLADTHGAPAVVSVCEAKPHPYKTYARTADGTLTDFVPNPVVYRRRQDLPPAFYDNGAIYLNRTSDLLRDRTYIPAGTVPYVMPAERSLDIDSEFDAMVADFLLRQSSGMAGAVVGARA